MCEKCEREEIVWAFRMRIIIAVSTLLLIGLAGCWLLGRFRLVALVPYAALGTVVMVAAVWGVFIWCRQRQLLRIGMRTSR